MTASLYMHDNLYAFLKDRRNMWGSDARIAADLRHKRYSDVSGKDENYLNVEWDKQNNRALVSFITHERYITGYGVGAYEDTRRQTVKPGRIFAKLLGMENGGGLEMDTLVQALNAHMLTLQGGMDRVHVICGDLIGKWYDNRMYCRCTYNGGIDSCMSHSGYDACGVLDLYKDNAEMVVVLCDECGYLQSRAILWTDRDANKKYVDRIYGNDTNIKLVQKWAQERGYPSVYGYQSTGYVGSSVRIQLMTAGYDRLPYLDSIELCDSCDCGYFGGSSHDWRHCSPHSHTIVRPRMTWDKDKDFGPVYEACEYCGGNMVADPNDSPEDSHGHERICEHATYCRRCHEYHCSEQCEGYATCEHCGEVYDVNDGCPNANYCDEHEIEYCGGDCPRASLCDECGSAYCAEQCEYCYVHCYVCDGWRSTDVAYCPTCSSTCATCGNTTAHADCANSGRCRTCDAMLYPERALDKAYEYARDNIDDMRVITLNAAGRNFYDGIHCYCYASGPTDPYREYRRGLERYSNRPLPYTVTIPRDVRHELYVAAHA